MKKNIIKSALAIVAVAAVGFGGVEAYNAFCTQPTESEMLLAENVEALSQGDANSYRYPKREGNPKFCTLELYISSNTGYSYKNVDSLKAVEGDVKFSIKKVRGLEDKCPDRGEGCNPYSCQEVKY